MTKKSVSIIIPVYADWLSLEACINSLIEFVDLRQHKVMLINDCGPEADKLEKKIKAKIKGQKGFEYFRNSKNLGFVGTCNHAVLELDKTNNDVLLLNSDTKATKGFLDEMSQVLYLSSKYAAVSPRSDNASIATVPLSQAIHHGIVAEESYRIYQKIKSKLPRFYIAPVAIGYCMLIKRALINKYSLFDQVFGKGYGEEVDFCLRLKSHGYLSVFANRAYVFHFEARSFSMERKKELIDKHNQIIWKRYPDYRQDVRDWMDDKVPAETAIEKAAGIDAVPEAKGIRKVLKPYPRLYRVARGVHRKLKNT